MKVKIFDISRDSGSYKDVEKQFNDLLASGVRLVQVLQTSTNYSMGFEHPTHRCDSTIITVIYEEVQNVG
ncbi:MAG: hypothetical protein U0514_03835 [Candidatus Andersenbacteria bacterium]